MIDHKNISEIVRKLINFIYAEIPNELKQSNNQENLIEYISYILAFLVGSFASNVNDEIFENKKISLIDEIFRVAILIKNDIIENELKNENFH